MSQFPTPILPRKAGATDTESMDSRQAALEWLYTWDGRDKAHHPLHNTYTGLWAKACALNPQLRG